MFSTVLLRSDLFPFPRVRYCWARASVGVSTSSCLSFCSEQGTAMLSNSALSHKHVVLLPIYLEPLPLQDDSIPVAPSEVLKDNVG